LKKTAFILIIASWFFTQGFAQNVQVTCVGDTAMRYVISGSHKDMLFHWKPEGGKFATSDTLNDTIFVNWNEPGEHYLSVYGEYQGCFTNVKELKVNLKASPILTLGANVEMCQFERHTFEVDTSFKTVVWHDKSIGRMYTSDTTETVWARVSDRFGCETMDSARVTMHLAPSVNLGKDTFLCGYDELILNAYSEDATSYHWNVQDKSGFDKTTSEITISKGDKIYAVAVENSFGCANYDTIHISKCPWPFDASKLPKAFTPNGDGKNECWYLDGLAEDYPDAIVEIYDRGGRLIFQSERGFKKPWCGNNQASGEILPMDNYYYIINLNDKNNGTANGSVLLVR
jgi:gliding motility-associated-like protein